MGAPAGNSNRANQYRIKRTLEAVLQRRTEARADGIEALEVACGALVDKAEEGDVAAFRELADRIDGKAAQALELSGPEGGPILGSVDWNIVHPK